MHEKIRTIKLENKYAISILMSSYEETKKAVLYMEII